MSVFGVKRRLNEIEKEMVNDKKRMKGMCLEDLKKMEKKYEEVEAEVTKILSELRDKLLALNQKQVSRARGDLPQKSVEWIANLKSISVTNKIREQGGWEFSIVDGKGNIMKYGLEWEEDGKVANLDFTTPAGERIEWSFCNSGEKHDTETAKQTRAALGLDDVSLGDFVGLLYYIISFIADQNKKSCYINFQVDCVITSYL